ncbi:hypothetical protein HYY72_03985 [Candidatus Woesearchaeota archaeon]|nr:hypothetical protein [Candidatus Woesearchaeota archaeon]
MQLAITSETPITLADLKEGIARIRKRDSDPNFRVKRTEEYISVFSKLNGKDSAALYEKLSALNIPRLRDIHICKIIDMMPAEANELKLILQGYTITVSNENLKKIVDIVKEYAD